MNLIKSLRISAILEGISYLLLLFIAMPLKYGMGMDMAVRIVGMIHGLLFIVLCWFLLQAKLNTSISFRLCVIVFIASLIPFGAFWADGKLKRLQL